MDYAKVLIIDTNIDLYEYSAGIWAEYGIKTRRVVNIEQALEELSVFKYHLIVIVECKEQRRHVLDSFPLFRELSTAPIVIASTDPLESKYCITAYGQGLLSGSLYCGHCGARLIQTSNVYRRPKADGTKVEHIRIRYVCYNKTRHPQLCNGQTGYTVSKVDELIETLVLEMLSNAKQSPRAALLDSQYKEHMANVKGNLKRAETALGRHEANLEVLKKELLAVIKGESILDRATLNETIAETKAGLEKASSDVAYWQGELGRGEAVAEQLSVQFQQVMSWASAYSTSTFEEKKMIIAQIVDKIHLKRDYEVSVELKINYRDFCSDISEELSEAQTAQ